MAAGPRRRASGGIGGDAVIVEAAWLYYHDGMNQNEIAARLGVSRATVVSYLQEAREKGFVRVRLADKVFTGHRLALALAARFGLKAAYVVEDGADPGATLRRVARGAAEWLPALLAPGDRLGVAWGRTVYEMAEALDAAALDDLTVLQLVGAMPSPYGFTAEICSTLLAARLGADCVNLYSPAVLSSADLAARLRREPVIEAQLAALDGINKAVFAAGSSLPDSHVVSSGVATVAELEGYVARGAVGVLCGRFVDAAGRPVPGPLNDRIVGIGLDRLTGLEIGLALAAGPDKIAPTRAVLAGGYATHLVTSRGDAEALLESR